MPFEYAHTRKACYQYSWDWAPYMNTMGIWKPARLEFYNGAKINYVWIRDKLITPSKAVLNFAIVLESSSIVPKNLKIGIHESKDANIHLTEVQ